MSSVLARGVTVVAGRRRLVDEVDLDVSPGRWHTIIGPNGAGKTTLVEALVGARPMTSGSVLIAGCDVRTSSARTRARVVAFVPQRPAAPPGMAVRDYVGLGLVARVGALRALSPDSRHHVEETLGRLGLADEAERDVSTLSGGERQRAVIARAIIQSAPVVVLDEPTTGLDIRHQLETLELLRREVDEHGITVVATLHDLTLSGQFADEVMLLAAGRVALTGTPQSVLRSSALTAAYGIDIRVVDVDGRDVVVPSRPRLDVTPPPMHPPGTG